MARILIVDDNADVRAVVSSVLAAAGHDVLIAPNGTDAISLQRESPAHVVITDILMPGKDGLETIRDLKEQFPGVKIIVMSGAGRVVTNTEPHLFTAKAIGADVVLRKPFAPEVLVRTVQEVLAMPSSTRNV